ncbi:S8 family serine peptidase [Jiangella asiatica]|uniref:alpha-amylase n=1 Tax=Jiangella asiatica TaxID=2530372 RepID=A0A4R5CQ99_9ACTN|nr:S8 family serine peptidase [Jiangella asiatica]TDE01490.1 hypothetical protein E1269_23205 [Jiangella asiatica]
MTRRAATAAAATAVAALVVSLLVPLPLSASAELSDPSGAGVVVVLAGTADLTAIEGDRDAVVAELKDVAARSQPAVREAVERAGGTVRAALWLTNALVVELPEAGSQGAFEALAELSGVDRVVPNFAVTPLEPAATTATATTAVDAALAVGDATWGVDRIGADRVHDELGIDGSGVRVATIDSGVDIGHPDLAGRMATDDPADPAHPGGWMEFDRFGGILRSTPYDGDEENGHGTHVAGTIHGGDTSGVAIGVAPGALMMHAPFYGGGDGTWAQVVSAMQWAIDPFDQAGEPAGEPADVLSMSLGSRGYLQELIAPVQAVRAAGVFPAVAIGNDCEPGQTASPGNVLEAVGVGATDRTDTVTAFSCGGPVRRSDWADAPADWPDSYVKPDLSAPGADVYSSLPGGGYGVVSGTSMATPHVAGAAALLFAAAPGLTVDEAVAALTDTAYFDERHGAQRPNARFGAGRIDAHRAVLAVTGGTGIAGIVTDAATGAPVAGATVAVGGRVTRADDTGAFHLLAPAGSRTVEVAAGTYRAATLDVTVPAHAVATADVELAPEPAGSVTGRVAFGPTGAGVPGAAVEVLPAAGTTPGTTAETSTDASGEFDLGRLAAGSYRLRAHAPGLPPSAPLMVEVAAGRDTAVELALSEPASVELVSAGPDGEPADGTSSNVSISADGRYVAFDSYAGNLVPGDTNRRADVFVRDTSTGEVERVSLGAGGAEGNSDSVAPAISADGRYVAFESLATTLADGDTPFTMDVFVHDRVTGTTERVSVGPGGATGPGWSSAASISGDGRYVTFSSYAAHLVEGDVNGTGDVFVRDRSTGTTRLISLSATGEQGNGASTDGVISADGQHVAFESAATNLAGEDTNERGDVFVRDLVAGTTELVSVAADGTQGEHSSAEVAISGDGRVVAFTSLASTLVPGDTNRDYDVFVRDRTAGSIELASLGGDASSTRPRVSGDGRHVAFASGSTGLVPGDTNGAHDVFVRDLELDRTDRVSLRADGGQADGTSIYSAINADGQRVAVYSEAPNLVDGDTNRLADVFVVDRSPEAGPAARFAVHDLEVTPGTARPGEPVTVAVQVTNLGAAAGDLDVPLTVAGAEQPVRTAAPGPGETTTLTWTTTPSALGGHDVRAGAGPHEVAGSVRVRPPEVELETGLAGAAVSLVDGDRLARVATTGADGGVSFETTTASGSYTVVVHRPGTTADPTGYLLTQPVTVDDDTEVEMSAEQGTAVLDLRLDQAATGHQALTYLRPETTGPHGFAFAPGPVVVTRGGYDLRHVHQVAGFERSWLGVSDVVAGVDVDADATHRFGGPGAASLTAAMDTGTQFTTGWSVTDAHGIPFSVMTLGELDPARPASPAVPRHAVLEDLPATVRVGPPAEVVLRMYDASGRQVHGGGLAWDQRRLTRDLNTITGTVDRRYRLELEIEAGPYPPAEITATAHLRTNRRTS